MKWIVVRLLIWLAILGCMEYLFFNFDSYIPGFAFLLGTNIIYVIILQIKMFIGLFRKNQKPGLKRIFNLSSMHHLFWTFSVFFTLLFYFGIPYLEPVLWDAGLELLNVFPALEYHESFAKDFLLGVNATYLIFLILRLLTSFFRKNVKTDEQQPQEKVTEPKFRYEEPKYCPSCKAVLESGDRFCPQCGSNIFDHASGGRAV